MIHPRTRSTFLALAGLTALAHLSCGPKSSPQGTGGGGGTIAQPGGGPPRTQGDVPDGLTLRLGEGRDAMFATGGPMAAPLKGGGGAPISKAEVEQLLSRMQAIKSEGDDRKDFALRDRSQPPPRPGETIKTPFPPPGSAGKPPVIDPKRRELTVLRHAPDGNVPMAPHLSITFSLPMIAVTSHGDAVKNLPVKLSPQPKGTWRWIGTQTLLFDPDPRFPQATTYTVDIAAGTRAATGETLTQAVSFGFTTPAPRLLQSYPTGGPHRRDPVLFAQFDQKIDPAAVLPTIAVTAGGKRSGLRLATAKEIAASEPVAAMVAAAKDGEQTGRWLAFVVDAPLPTDTQIAVTVGPGTPSLEGPRTTGEAQSWNFRTYGPMKVVRAQCWGDCPPGHPWSVEFSNPIDMEAFESITLKVSPEITKLKSWVNGNYLTVQGRSQGRTTYELTVPGSLRDEFGQVLGKDEKLTFKVGSAYPYLQGPQGLVVLDPAAVKPSFDVFSTNFDKLHVQVWKVDPTRDWRAFTTWMQEYYRNQGNPPGKLAIDARIPTKGGPDAMTETAIDLEAALDGRFGHAIVMVTPEPWKQTYDPPVLRAWVQATGISLDAFIDGGELIGWANRLDDGRPLDGVKLVVAPFGTGATTDAKGIARVPLAAAAQKGPRVLYATRGKDVAFLPESLYYWDGNDGGWLRHDQGEELRWHVFDDRGMYRPGEKVRIKGWLRRIDNREGGDVAGLAGAVDEISWQLIGPQGNKMGNGKTAINALGGFDLALDLPKTPNLGQAVVQLKAVGKGKLGGRDAEHPFQIQEFRRPEYEVSASVSPGPHIVGGAALATVKAAYFAGGGLANAEVRWNVVSSNASFTPPNRDDWVFGTFVPWWNWREDGGWVEPKYATYEGKTDPTGQHVLKIDLVSLEPPRPMQVTAQASVMDVNRQEWGATTMFVVHPANLYVGLKSPVPFVEAGKPIEVDSIVVDLDGKAVPGNQVSLRAVRIDWKVEKGVWKEVEEDPQTCELTSSKDAGRCTFKTGDEGGRFVITAQVVDKQTRVNETELSVWVSGGQQPPERNVTQEQVMLIPDKKDYRPGETAQVLVQSPFFPAEGVLSLRRSGIVSTERFRMTGPTTTLKIPVVDAYTPNLWVQVDLVGSAPRVGDDGKPDPKLPRRPAYAIGSLDLAVPPLQRTLGVKVTPRDPRLEPGGKTNLAVVVTDAGGQPVAGAELAVVVVDEAVLALSSYQLRDPLATFYSDRDAGAADYHHRAYVTLARPDLDSLGGDRDGDGVADTADLRAADDDSEGAPGGPMPPPSPSPPGDPAPEPKAEATRAKNGHGGGGNAGAPIAVRTNFDPLAVFSPAVKTGADGKASVAVSLPDNLTRYRVMVVAVAGERQFGKGESAITARMPLMVRPSPPRFLNFGDRFELPVVLQNQTDGVLRVRVAVRAANLALTGDHGYALEIPANDRVEVRFDAAAEMPGTARLQVAAASDKWADAAELALPVWTPATTEAFATYGTIETGAIKQPVALPADVQPAFGGLEITTSSTQLQALTDAFLYLVAYPYECAEQLSSRVLAVAALRDVLTAFKADGLPPPAQIEAAVKRDLERLETLQNSDGGFGFWRRGDESWPYPSIHVAHALARAQAKKYAVPASMMQRSLEYLREIRNRTPGWYPEEVKRTIEAYALYVRKLAGDADPARARNLLSEGGGIDARPLEAVGWIYGVLAGDAGSAKELAQIRRHLDNKATETAGAAHFVTSYGDGAYLLLHSDRRVDGIILESLLADQPKNDLVPKVVRGLLAHRKAGRWENTQENAFVLLALDRYFHEYEKVTPNFVARAWLGDALAGEHTFKGRTTDYKQIDVPMAWLAKHKTADLTLAKDGAGRLYYRIGMTYAPKSLKLDPADHGFAVQRVYEAVDKPTDVVRQADGSWKIRAGARVRVKLSMVAQSRRYHVALVDPLPAGLEAMNPALAVTGNIPQAPAAQKRDPWWWWNSVWYEHQNLRDERVEAFASLLWEGVHEYSYVARATTPGSFVVPPTKAEEMYHPETFGRSASDRVIVE